MTKLYGGIEAGGTKFVCAVGSGPEDLRSEIRFPTTTPDETIGRTIAFLREASAKEPLSALGIASFGPLDPDTRSPTFGRLKATPKAAWTDIDLVGPIAAAFRLPVAFDTDVNGAAIAEGRWGAAKDLETFVYLTVGTGIGGGALVAGRPIHGLLHPEMGHIQISRRHDDDFPGACPYHDECFEGLASGPAIEQRWGRRAEELAADHPAWELEAHYLALGLANIVCVLAPQRIVLGGGVMNQQHLFPLVRRKLRNVLNGYVQAPGVTDDSEHYIVPPGLGNRSGVLGALAMAADLCLQGGR